MNTINEYLPRRPKRSNGWVKYNHLLDMTERLILEQGIGSVSIHAISKLANVPQTSTYHFFPHTNSVCIALAERYFKELQALLLTNSPKTATENNDFFGLLYRLIDLASDYYNSNDAARNLILGSDFSWYVKLAEIENNRYLVRSLMEMATAFTDFKFEKKVEHSVNVAASMCESIWSLSIAHHARITDQYRQDAKDALGRYLEPIFQAMLSSE